MELVNYSSDNVPEVHFQKKLDDHIKHKEAPGLKSKCTSAENRTGPMKKFFKDVVEGCVISLCSVG